MSTVTCSAFFTNARLVALYHTPDLARDRKSVADSRLAEY